MLVCGSMKLRSMHEHMRRSVEGILLGMPRILIGRSTVMPKTLETANKGHHIKSRHRYATYTRKYSAYVQTRYARSCAL